MHSGTPARHAEPRRLHGQSLGLAAQPPGLGSWQAQRQLCPPGPCSTWETLGWPGLSSMQPLGLGPSYLAPQKTKRLHHPDHWRWVRVGTGVHKTTRIPPAQCLPLTPAGISCWDLIHPDLHPQPGRDRTMQGRERRGCSRPLGIRCSQSRLIYKGQGTTGWGQG